MKYNKREIMRNAWAIRKSASVSMSVALKAAWNLAKAMNEAEEIGEQSGWNHKVSANDWVKYGKNRTYVSARIYTNAWNLKREIKVCYIDNMTGERVAC
jgi:hypothetical protein